MVTKEMIERINELAAKKKKEGLTAEETAEQAELRRKYIQTIKQRTREHLDRIKFVEDLSDEEREKLEKEKAEKKKTN